MTVKNLTMTLMIASMVFAGCVSDLLPFGGVHEGTYDLDRLGTGTEEVDDMIVQLILINSTSPIKFNDGTAAQDGGEHYRFRMIVGDVENESSPTFECRLASDSPGDCLITESVEDGVWNADELITFSENGADICSEGCRIQLTIMNGDIVTEQEENLRYIADKSISGPVTHTHNFWMSQ